MNFELKLQLTIKSLKTISQQKTLTEGGLEFKAANQCSDFLNQFRKSPDGVRI